ncbi:MAG: hypothetical protein Q9N26_04520, partial [Aquificota bacterium]|nr:hypothetical protein [Aquificota bacterium]
MKKFTAVAIAVFVWSLLGIGSNFYSFYYDRSAGQDLSINLLNPTPNHAYYLITVYDVYGNGLWQTNGTLTPHEGVFYTLSDYITGDTNNWGLVTVETGSELVIGLEYLLEGELISTDVITEPLHPMPNAPYWLASYYSQAAEVSTGVIVLNPWNTFTSLIIGIYSPDGEPLYTTTVNLPPHAGKFLDLESAVGKGGKIWGLVDVTMGGQSVVLAMEYYYQGKLE